jgi:hypothetical protein
MYFQMYSRHEQLIGKSRERVIELSSDLCVDDINPNINISVLFELIFREM